MQQGYRWGEYLCTVAPTPDNEVWISKKREPICSKDIDEENIRLPRQIMRRGYVRTRSQCAARSRWGGYLAPSSDNEERISKNRELICSKDIDEEETWPTYQIMRRGSVRRGSEYMAKILMRRRTGGLVPSSDIEKENECRQTEKYSMRRRMR